MTTDAPYFAAIDLGSNSFHMLIARDNHGEIEIVDRVKDMVQIARGLQRDGTLSHEAQGRALHCLACFAERIRNIPANHIRAVGTKALRAAQNAKSFLSQAEDALGQPISIISGYEEARLVYRGVSHAITRDKRRRLVIDIGGGSTEFIIGLNHQPQLLESLSIGCVTYAERFFNHAGSANVSLEAVNNTYLATCEELEGIRREYCQRGWDMAIGASGTMRAIAELMPDNSLAGIITREGLEKLISETLAEGRIVNLDVPKLRRDVLPAGLAILRGIFDQLGIEELHVADATLKEGLIYDTIGRLAKQDIRDTTVENLIQRYQIDSKQAQRVQDTALKLFHQLDVKPLSHTQADSILGWAAKLHEIGLSLSHSNYHKHGQYILNNADMAGFSRFEQQLMSTLVRSHRRNLKPDLLQALGEQVMESCLPMVFCLRLATLLNRRRENVEQLPRIDWKDGRVKLAFIDGWLDEHPLTRVNLAAEANWLAAIEVDFHYR